ncbi:hypothetical protein EUGRSUZ_K03286 [Eucalyptus grandis]|uniref:Uncharacterized protein n=2 Tax=Eucalyptus grandis TaxID=71139 RepID=A0ACC3IZP4_EUCGR|nr:hypothetical protein EUGRSUZ_K03286 [Eucalyptus grandis]
MIPTKVVDQVAKNQVKHQAITLKKKKTCRRVHPQSFYSFPSKRRVIGRLINQLLRKHSNINKAVLTSHTEIRNRKPMKYQTVVYPTRSLEVNPETFCSSSENQSLDI